jgi:hypothetical protein
MQLRSLVLGQAGLPISLSDTAQGSSSATFAWQRAHTRMAEGVFLTNISERTPAKS